MAPVQSVYYTDNDAVEAIEKMSNKNTWGGFHMKLKNKLY